jgi:hypothetical protein
MFEESWNPFPQVDWGLSSQTWGARTPVGMSGTYRDRCVNECISKYTLVLRGIQKKSQDCDVAAIAIWTVFPSFYKYTFPMPVFI